MIDYLAVERDLLAHLRFEHRPVAIAFLDLVPNLIARFVGTVPALCTFWRLASEGRTFYAAPSDHYNCAIGAYTHHIPMPLERSKELDDTIGFMSSIGYIGMDEVPGIPQILKEPRAVVYAPLGETPVDPDVVLFIGRPNHIMLLQEAAIRGGVASKVSALARPTCMALPAAISSGITVSVGCVGNRVYTEIGDGDMYAVVPARDILQIAKGAEAVANANAVLIDYHADRRNTIAGV
jgi:uncharacterized protein (DUF169 family)